jgi:small-conductance mechanosensitive channel
MENPAPETGKLSPMERIEQAVQLEHSRRRRMLRLYSVLLLVPIGIFIVLLVFGRSDRQTLEQAVDMRVKPVEAQYQAIQPALDSIHGLDTILPRVNRAAQYFDTQAARLSSLARTQESLTQAVAGIPEQIRMIDGRLQQFDALRTDVPRIREQLTHLQSNLTDIRALQDRLGMELNRQDRAIKALGDPTVLRQRMDVLEHRLDSMGRTRTLPRPVPQPGPVDSSRLMRRPPSAPIPPQLRVRPSDSSSVRPDSSR